MRPALGVAVEVVLLVGAVALFASSSMFGGGIPSLIVILLAQGGVTYLIHCPAHYLVGGALGIKFSRMRMGRTTFTAALPESLRRYSRSVPTPSLSIMKESRERASPLRLKAMYVSGAAASTGSAVVFAAAVTFWGAPTAATVSWAFALAYLASDLVMSPKAGDLMRANAVKWR